MFKNLINILKEFSLLSFDNGETFATMDIDKINKIDGNIVIIGNMEDEQGQHYDYEYNINGNDLINYKLDLDELVLNYKDCNKEIILGY